jgi:hypothetical protein
MLSESADVGDVTSNPEDSATPEQILEYDIPGERTQAPPPTEANLDEAITLLDPEYLEKIKGDEDKRKDTFLREVLPILATRLDHCTPISPPTQENMSDFVLQMPTTPWLQTFTSTDFRISKAREVFDISLLKHINDLHRFVVFKSAQIMYDKLWRYHAEFYSLGLGYHTLGKVLGADRKGKSVTWKYTKNSRACDEALNLLTKQKAGRTVAERCQKDWIRHYWRALDLIEVRIKQQHE